MLTKGLDSQLDNTVPANQLRRMRLNILLVVRTQVIKAPYCTWTACNAMFIFIYIHTVHTVYKCKKLLRAWCKLSYKVQQPHVTLYYTVDSVHHCMYILYCMYIEKGKSTLQYIYYTVSNIQHVYEYTVITFLNLPSIYVQNQSNDSDSNYLSCTT